MNFSSVFQFFPLRWISEAWTRIQTRNSKISNVESSNGNSVTSSTECYACSRDDNPVFHSTSWDGIHQPEWKACAGSHLFPPEYRIDPNKPKQSSRFTPSGLMGPILDPRSSLVQKWNRVLVLARGVSLAVDPVFFYVLSFHVAANGTPCLYLNVKLAVILTILRTCLDILHLCHIWIQFRLAYVARESLVIGNGKLVWDARAIAIHYLRSLRGFWFDAFVILPIPQVLIWLVVPRLIKEEMFNLIINLLLIMILLQFFPKVYHSLCLMSRMRKVTGYVFGSIWWGFGLNLIAYLIFSHVAGGCWYALATQRVAKCLQQQCEKSNCTLTLFCSRTNHQSWFSGSKDSEIVRRSVCLVEDGPFPYGIYGHAIPVIYSNSVSDVILYPIFWGLLNLSSFGNELDPTSESIELIFCIFIVICGFTLLTLLIGNIQICLRICTERHKWTQLRRRDMEWWMNRRQLPSGLRKRVRHFERQKCDAMIGNELKWIDELPDGLRKDIRRYLCLDLIKKVPLFHNLDDLILDNICDRVKPLIYSKDEKIFQEGDPVQRMVFVVNGRIKRTQNLSKGKLATSILESGCFLGDELLSWSLRRPFFARLPPSSATFTCMEPMEGFALKANDLRFITDHFRYSFANERQKQTARYYSSNWRSWGAVVIQIAWREYKMRKVKMSTDSTDNCEISEMGNGGIDDQLRKYAMMFMSMRPHDHLE